MARTENRAGTTAGTMRAMGRDVYGPPEVLSVREVPVPGIGRGQVLVKVRAAGLDRGVPHVAAGLPYLIRPVFGIRRPRAVTLGLEMAGVVEAVGADVTGLAVGDEVFGAGNGAFAEYVVAKPKNLARIPGGATFEQAAVLPVSGTTALQALRDRGRVQAGQHVLVVGASGGVGTYAVQIAKAMGARVTGVCSGPKLDLVRSMGADEVVDYQQDDLAGHAGRYHVVLDIGGNRPLRLLRGLLRPGGRLVIVGGEEGGRWFGGMDRQLRAMAWSPFVREHLGTFVATTNAADLDVLREMVEAGSVRPVVDRVCTLDELPAAVADLEAGRVRGKVAVSVAPEHRPA